MATLQIEIRDKKFAAHNGVNIQVFTETHVAGNGWAGYIDENGNVDFFATRFYKGIRHKIKFQIVDGTVMMWLKIGDKPRKVLKHYKIDEWPTDGIVGISNGILTERIAYFRKPSFQKFLDEHQITAVRNESPNQIYYNLEEHNGYVLTCIETILTDGKSKILSRDVNLDETCDLRPYSIYEMIEITDASWVIKTVSKNGEIRHRILYTLEEPQEIVGLP